MMFAKVINECNCAKSIMRYIIANNNNNTDECTILHKQMHSCCDNETICEFNAFIDKYIKQHVSESDYQLHCMIRDFEPIDEIINYFNNEIKNKYCYRRSITIYTMISNAIKYGNVKVFKFAIMNGYFTNTTPYNILLGLCGNAEIFKIMHDYSIRKNNATCDMMYLFCNPLLVDIDKTFSIAIDIKWIKLFISYFNENIIMFPNIICYVIQNDMFENCNNYIHFVKNIVFVDYNTIGENYCTIVYDNYRKQIIDAIVNDSNMNESKMKLLCEMFLRNIDTYVLCEKQLYPLAMLFKLIGNRIEVLSNKTISKIINLKNLNYDDLYIYRRLIVLMVTSNNYSILHKMMEINNVNKVIKLSYDVSINIITYSIYHYENLKYNFVELNMKYLEYIKNHFMY